MGICEVIEDEAQVGFVTCCDPLTGCTLHWRRHIKRVRSNAWAHRPSTWRAAGEWRQWTVSHDMLAYQGTKSKTWGLIKWNDTDPFKGGSLWIFFIFFEVDVILKLYGFNGNFDVDRLMSGSQIWAELSGTQLLRTMCREAAQRCETEDMEETLQCFDDFWCVHSKRTYFVQTLPHFSVGCRGMWRAWVAFGLTRTNSEQQWLDCWNCGALEPAAGLISVGTGWNQIEIPFAVVDVVDSCFSCGVSLMKSSHMQTSQSRWLEDFRRYLIAEPIGDLSSDDLVPGSGCPCRGHRLDVLGEFSWILNVSKDRTCNPHTKKTTQKGRVYPPESIHQCWCRAKRASICSANSGQCHQLRGHELLSWRACLGGRLRTVLKRTGQADGQCTHEACATRHREWNMNSKIAGQWITTCASWDGVQTISNMFKESQHDSTIYSDYSALKCLQNTRGFA